MDLNSIIEVDNTQELSANNISMFPHSIEEVNNTQEATGEQERKALVYSTEIHEVCETGKVSETKDTAKENQATVEDAVEAEEQDFAHAIEELVNNAGLKAAEEPAKKYPLIKKFLDASLLAAQAGFYDTVTQGIRDTYVKHKNHLIAEWRNIAIMRCDTPPVAHVVGLHIARRVFRGALALNPNMPDLVNRVTSMIFIAIE